VFSKIDGISFGTVGVKVIIIMRLYNYALIEWSSVAHLALSDQRPNVSVADHA
jgi:hypothetical protein